MQTTTLLYIILAGIIALLLALFQYRFKAKKSSRVNLFLAFLRFLSVFGLLLLLINPKFEQTTFYNEKPNLILAVDNSESVSYLEQDGKASTLVSTISENQDIRDRFNIETFTFGKTIQQSDSLSFTDTQSNLNTVFNRLGEVYKNSVSPVVFITDGNQTYGSDYEFATTRFKQPIFPIILGDTITFADLKIQKLNVNKYAYLKNRFPVEAILVYSGNESVSAEFRVKSGNAVVYRNQVAFNANDASKVLSFNLPANRVGVRTYTAELVPLASEKNMVNNIKNFAVEVIDQQTKVAIVTDIVHPDLGALKKSIERNEQRKADIINSSELIDKISDYQLIILYQPNNNFRLLLQQLNQSKINSFLIAGTKTNWSLLNNSQSNFHQEITNQQEDYQAELNANYSTFIVEDLGFENFPPLKSSFGEITFNLPIETILYKTINRINTDVPLLATYELNGKREAILLGEDIWKWRAQSYLDKKSFNAFDDFIGKLVQYLGSDQRRSRLNLDYESFYNGNDNLVISAQYFNKNYEFDSNKNLDIILKNNENNSSQSFPFILKNNNYEVDLSGIEAGEYQFTVRVVGENMSRSGTIKVLEYNVEQQFLNADVTKLQRLATKSDGRSYFIDNSELIINDLLEDNRFVTIQKSTKNIVPLIDFKYLLGLIALCLALEWFTRKYNGLI